MVTRKSLLFLGMMVALFGIAGWTLSQVGGDGLRESLFRILSDIYMTVVGIVALVVNFFAMLILGVISAAVVDLVDEKVDAKHSFGKGRKLLLCAPISFIFGLWQIPVFYSVLTNPVSKNLLHIVGFHVGPFETEPPFWVLYGAFMAILGYFVALDD